MGRRYVSMAAGLALLSACGGADPGSPVHAPVAAPGSPSALSAPVWRDVFAYVITERDRADTGHVAAYAVNVDTGSLQLLSKVEVHRPKSLAAHSGRFLYVAGGDLGRTAVLAYEIDAGGGLVEAGRFPGAGSKGPRRVATAGRFLTLIGDDSSTGYAVWLEVRSVDEQTGALEVLSTHRPKTGGYGIGPVSLAAGAEGRFVYEVSRRNAVVAYRMDGGGRLSSLGEAPTPAEPFEAAVHPSGRFLYAACGSRQGGGGFVAAYAVGGPGAPTPAGTVEVPGPAPYADPAPSLAVDPSGRFVYASSSAGIQILAVGPSSGALAYRGQAPGSPKNGDVAVEPGGRFLYVSDRLEGEVHAYRIDGATGELGDLGPVARTQRYEGGDLVLVGRP